MTRHLSAHLRALVDQSVSLLGEVLLEELGPKAFFRIEVTRQRMTRLRGASVDQTSRVLSERMAVLEKLSPAERLAFARAYTLMLELMNACENAYRSHEIRRRTLPAVEGRADSILYVLTAHPTEARAVENIWVFHQILRELTGLLEKPPKEWKTDTLKHWIRIAWKTHIVRRRKPRVCDEALRPFLRFRREGTPVFLRSWVGGDKDGHPGVDEKVFLESLGFSRRHLLSFVQERAREVRVTVEAFQSGELLRRLKKLTEGAGGLRRIRVGDGRRVESWRRDFQRLCEDYSREVGDLHPSLEEVRDLLELFPALVVPLELRESSDVLMSSPSGEGLAIFRMLKTLAKISSGRPQDYARGLIISMAASLQHVQVAADQMERTLGSLKLPIIPLFEQAESLENSRRIVGEMLADRRIGTAIRGPWGQRLEVMVGYSDSSKESGVLWSRLKIAENMHALDRFCSKKGVTPIFFQGSGGSVDRGGGSVQEQTAWWPAGALRNYKVTVQGEMVERSFANAEITRGQLERIAQSAGRWRSAKGRELKRSKVLDRFAERVAGIYRERVASPEFLSVVEMATPYRSLDVLRIGSRPTKRASKVSLQSLRAIPWVLCWTQTRVLFPTWWGVGTAWAETSASDKTELKRLFKRDPLFATYMRALGFTLLKVEMGVWCMYLRRSRLPRPLQEKIRLQFLAEFSRAMAFARAILGKDFAGSRAWLEESIRLRSPMIHPLNLLQILAMETGDVALFRVSVTGIASGMMTTG
jgi:phosphoenolpyruvate carboxylase